MQVLSSRFGTVEVDPQDIIEMPVGLFGFPDVRRFIIIDQGEDNPFKWLQAVDDPALAFVIIDPLIFKPDYRVVISKKEVGDLGLVNENEAKVYVIVVITDNPYDMTANLLGPLIINPKTRKAKQIVLSESEYTTKHYIISKK
ncbi:MAG: flagellar assembly protein FliW [bacterium]